MHLIPGLPSADEDHRHPRTVVVGDRITGAVVERGLELEQVAAQPLGFFLDPRHHFAADAAAPLLAVDQIKKPPLTLESVCPQGGGVACSVRDKARGAVSGDLGIALQASCQLVPLRQVIVISSR